MNDFANKSNSMTHTFTIDHVSEVDGQRYHGQFTTEKLNIGRTIELGVRKTQLAAGLSYNPESGRGLPFTQDLLCEMVAHCEVALIAKPSWFDNPLDLFDMEVLNAVYQEVIDFENQFRNRATGDSKQDTEKRVSRSEGRGRKSEGSSESEPQGFGDDDSAEVVGVQISKKSKK